MWFHKIFKKTKDCKICPKTILHPTGQDYINTINEWIELERIGNLKFIAGDCNLSDIFEHLDKEDIYALEHYFKCKCGRYYHSGVCIRGTPFLREEKQLPKNFKSRFTHKFSQIFIDNS